LKKRFYRYWTCKEALVKAIGTGLSSSLTDFTVNLEDEGTPYLDWEDNRSFSGKCRISTIPLEGDYCASLACLADPEHILFYSCLTSDT
jgi:phosphopantetheinyl transferase